MKREHYKEHSYIDWLKSLGCVFYCAFDGKTGTTDLINNVQLSLVGYGSCSYESQYDMYKISTPSSYEQMVGIWNNGLNNASFPNDNYTCLYSVIKITNSSNKVMSCISCVTDSSQTDDYSIVQATAPMWNGTSRTNSFPSGLCKYGYTCNHTLNNRSSYQNGALYTTATEYIPYLPSNWQCTGYGIMLCGTPVHHPYSHMFTSVQFYIGDVYLFNTALDLQTIRKIQGYE